MQKQLLSLLISTAQARLPTTTPADHVGERLALMSSLARAASLQLAMQLPIHLVTLPIPARVTELDFRPTCNANTSFLRNVLYTARVSIYDSTKSMPYDLCAGRLKYPWKRRRIPTPHE